MLRVWSLKKRSVNEVIINNKELASMNGDVDSFLTTFIKLLKIKIELLKYE